MNRTRPMLAAAFLAGTALGWSLAHFGAPSPTANDGTADLATRPPQGAPAPDVPPPAASPTPLELWELTSRIAALEALALDSETQRARVGDLAKRTVTAMSDAELSSVLMSTVGLSAEEVGDVRDVRAFANRMLDVAMQGITEAEQEVPGTPRVLFRQNRSTGDSPAASGSRFASGPGRVFASFPTPDPQQHRVLVKWFRTDRPTILLMQRYPLRVGDTSGYVWLDPEDGWEIGNYQVDVYADDEAVTLLASGRYEIW
ncbi:MAG: hypothetical protein VCB99_03480 [Myxococcota bacterium]